MNELLSLLDEVETSGVFSVSGTLPQPKFDGTCRKNQRRYDAKRNLFDTAQQIVKDLADFQV